MLRKVLIANRGEIACRIVRTARRMGIRTVAVYSDADARAMHVAAADEAVHIGASAATDSYLRIDRIVAAARATGADAIHPGYGFLSENPDLPEACDAAGLVFVGPTAAAMRALGGKAAAKEIAIKAGVPVVPGYQGGRQDAGTLAREAAKIGLPVMIKAVAGGGGRGMRLVERAEDLADLLASAQREAQSAFGNPAVLVEKAIQRPRHIEVQVFGDRHGNVVHLFERDCTLQRRNQKVIEEAPAPGMTAALRAKMCEAAVTLARAASYSGAGTVEFLVEGGALDASAKWYFIEMNTRLQVEHPVTEEITGLDLVEWQFRVAAGEPLPLKQEQIRMSGHAIEARVCAEDPAKGFMPSIARIDGFEVARSEGLRVETGVGAGSVVSPHYDSMIAKLIGHGKDRAEAIAVLRTALVASAIAGPQTNQTFLARLLDDGDVVRGAMDTGLIARKIDRLVTRPDPRAFLPKLVESWLAFQSAGTGGAGGAPAHSPWDRRDAFQLGPARRQALALVIDGAPAEPVVAFGRDGAIEIEGARAGTIEPESYATFADGTGRLRVLVEGTQITIEKPTYTMDDDDAGAASGTVRAPINGRIAKLFVVPGAGVAKGDKLAVVEAMKMEHVVVAAIGGSVDKVHVAEGAQVTQGTALVHIVAGDGQP